jgi:uncharacterized RmlC-like cupin family protein
MERLVTEGRCTRITGGARRAGAQGLQYREGITGVTAGSRAVCMVVAEIPPGGRSRAHLHHGIETAIYVMEGAAETWAGPRLEERVPAEAGDYLHIPADLPHVVVNRGAVPCRAVVVHAAPDDQQGIVLLPELDPLVP